MIPFFTAALAGNFILTVIAARILIPKLKSMKLGQKILDIGPRWHKSKEGTPTMGGLSFIFASLITAVIMSVVMVATDNSDGLPKLIIVLLGAAANGAVGVIDDLTKFHNHRNEGLTATQKYLLQLAAAAAFLAAMKLTGNLTTELYIPFVGKSVDLGIFYYIISLILITGVVNSVNLTDGIDGLASSVTLAVGAFFAVAAFMLGALPEAVLAGMTIGACLRQ